MDVMIIKLELYNGDMIFVPEDYIKQVVVNSKNEVFVITMGMLEKQRLTKKSGIKLLEYITGKGTHNLTGRGIK